MPLATLAQRDFAAGEFRGVAPHLIPDNGVQRARNCLLDEDGSLYKRGGTQIAIALQLGTSLLQMVWTGYLNGNKRTVAGNATELRVVQNNGAASSSAAIAFSKPTRMIEHQGLLFADGGTVIYGGTEVVLPNYSTGTVAVTNDSAVVTGTGTSWSGTGGGANMYPGMLVRFVVGQRYYVIQSVDSTTQITLTDAYEGTTASGLSYTATSAVAPPAPPYKAGYYAVAADKLLVGSGKFLYMSKPGKPHEFDSTDSHELPDGVEITGVEAINDRALIFTTAGLWTLSNLHYDLTDDFGNVQHRLEQMSDSMILWSREGVAYWDNSIVVPATDGCWLIDGISAPRLLTRSISKVWQKWVQDGYRTGVAAVHRGHYCLPIHAPGGTAHETRVCRLDRPQNTRLGTVYPWTYWDNTGQVNAFHVDAEAGITRSPRLLGASANRFGTVWNFNACFDPGIAVKRDGDGSAHVWEIVTKDYETGEGPESTVRRLRARYEMVDAATDNPFIDAAYRTEENTDIPAALWGTVNWNEFSWGAGPLSQYTALSGQAPEDNGGTPYTWHLQKKGRYIRFKLQSDDPVAGLILRSLEVFVRPSRRL